MENNPILKRAKEDLKDIEKKIWIQAYVSKKENPLIDLIASVLIFACSFVALYRYFTMGAPIPFWIHAVAFIVITICLVITHRSLNGPLTRKAEALCPITVSDFNIEEINSMEALLEFTSRNHFGKFKPYYAGPLSALISIIAWIFSFLYFSKFANLTVPSGCILYLVMMCIITSSWFFFVGFGVGQSLLLPLSREVKTALRDYRSKKKQEKAEAIKREQREKTISEAELKKQAKTAETQPKVEDEQEQVPKNFPAFYRDLPIYKQYLEEARIRSGTASYTNNGCPLSYAQKMDYINDHFSGLYSYHAIESIENDPNLTLAQKEDLKVFLKVYGD